MIPKDLMGQDEPLLSRTKLRLTMNAAILPGNKAILPVLCLYKLTLCEQEWTEGESLSRLVLLPAI